MEAQHKAARRVSPAGVSIEEWGSDSRLGWVCNTYLQVGVKAPGTANMTTCQGATEQGRGSVAGRQTETGAGEVSPRMSKAPAGLAAERRDGWPGR